MVYIFFKYFHSDLFVHTCRVSQYYTWFVTPVVYWFIHAEIWHLSNTFKHDAAIDTLLFYHMQANKIILIFLIQRIVSVYEKKMYYLKKKILLIFQYSI